ncbi:ComEA family DNA-binding protein [Desulfonema magnum]|uniref:Helix-hairpin-helix motif-containing protein n=1 Tax=Desulfonema magnum TaxID=45655 RepID=A0A975BLZ0_9BACT|nr:helix-hairpin-helix domain-containing protein [Desulfonema magnum]QTA87923.1 Helix-hairpin-helix motif-containing protein [Desulfonema magnum]
MVLPPALIMTENKFVSLAERIIKHQKKYGPFRTPGNITKFSGIGPKNFEINKDRITIGEPEEKTSKEKASEKKDAGTDKMKDKDKVSGDKKVFEV